MKLGIIGLAGSGKKTIFEALTQQSLDAGSKSENRIGTVQVPDPRIGVLSKMYNPKKTIYAQVEYLLPGHMDIVSGLSIRCVSMKKSPLS